jgi:hypothetical protein
VLDSILKSVLSAGHNVFPADILKDLGQGLEGQGDSVNDRAKNALDGVLKGAGDLFKKKK